jgi:hypothetical protein
MDKRTKKSPEEEAGQPKVYGDPVYSSNDDIYSKGEKVTLDDQGEGVEAAKSAKGAKGAAKKTSAGEDLDVPGSELDDADEQIGEEDEENNYYSLGGDDHDDLEEDKGE